MQLTFKVHFAIAVEVHIPEDLINFTVLELLSHKLPHSFPQLPEAYLTIAIRIKLEMKKKSVSVINKIKKRNKKSPPEKKKKLSKPL